MTLSDNCSLLQSELDDVAKVWNTHRIRPTRNQRAPYGRPILMYHTPEMYETERFHCAVSSDKIALCEQEVTGKNVYPCDNDVFELCCLLMEENNLSDAPEDAYEAAYLYVSLIHVILAII